MLDYLTQPRELSKGLHCPANQGPLPGFWALAEELHAPAVQENPGLFSCTEQFLF